MNKLQNSRNIAEWIIIASAIAIVRCHVSNLASGIVGAAAYDGTADRDPGDSAKNIGWDPKRSHPCTVETISMEDFLKKYRKQGGLPPLYPRPLVIKSRSGDPQRNQRFQELTREDTIRDSFPANFTVTLSSSNSFSEHRRTIPLSQYLEEVATGPPLDADTKSNETWYLFGETYSDEWKSLLSEYLVPPCQACYDESLVALSFGIGNSGSGVQWHIHGPGFSEAIHGRKHWVLYPFEDQPAFHPDQTSLNWMHYNYPSFEQLEDRPLECTLDPGDLIYFPDMWWHATINVDDYTAFVSTFTQEHLFLDRSETKKAWA